MTTTATRAQTTPWKQQQQQRPRFLTSRASVSFSSSSSSSSFLSKSSSSKGGRQQPRGHRRRSLPSEKTGRGVVVAGRFPDERTYIMIKCVVVYVVVVFRLSSWLLLDFVKLFLLNKTSRFFLSTSSCKTSSFSPGGGNETKTDSQNNNNSLYR